MRFNIIPVEIIQSPNYYSVLPDKNWVLYDESSTSLSFILNISDSLGDRPYIIANTDTLSVEFPRADLLSIQPVTRGTLDATSRSVNKTCIVDSLNKSLFTIQLTSSDIQNIMSGSALFTLKYGQVTRTWTENYILIKKINDVGM